MFSLHAFATSTSGVYGSLYNLAPVSDPVLATSGNFLYVPTLNNLIGVYGMGTGLLRLQLSSPSLLANVPYDVTPVDAAALPASPLPIEMHLEDPLKLVTDEPLQALMTTGSGTLINAFVFLSDGSLSKVSGNIIHARATATSGSTAAVWANSALSLTNQLAEGTYQLVGARIDGAHCIAGRFVFPGGTNATRPGLIASAAIGRIESQNLFRNGRMGVWGTFSNRVLPTVDLMSDGTGETVAIILDLIKTA